MTDDLKTVQKQIDQLQDMLKRMTGERKNMLFGEFALTYLHQKLVDPTLRDSTKKSFQNQIKNHLLPAFGDVQLESITNVAWLAWVSRMIETESGVTRFFNARKDLLEILNGARSAGHIQSVPKLTNPDEKRDVGRYLPDNEVLAILWHSRRPFRFIFYCFWKLGCRPREILQWKWSMFEWNGINHTWISIPAKIVKNDKPRRIALNPDICKLLTLRYARSNNEWVFPSTVDPTKPQLSYHSAWSRACRLAKVKAVAYDFRRTFITKCAIENKPLIYVAKHLDTSVKMIEEVYAKAQAEVMEGIVK